jgi:5-methylcytosine-specific restriction endonuclease McrA
MDNTYKDRYQRWYSNNKINIRKRKAELAKIAYHKNKDERLKRRKEYYYKNRELILKKQRSRPRKTVNEYAKSYREKHPFRIMANMANSRCNEKITATELFGIAKRQKMLCILTGEKLSRSNISLDHIMPRSLGGKNTKSNIRLITLQANMAKGNMLDDDFINLCQKIVSHSKSKTQLIL